MRLIDADVLLMKQASIARNCAKSEGQKALMGRVMYNTEKALTIPAIPVEWLNEMKRWAAADGDNECVYVIAYLLDRWQKEQEAK